jgi:hypothetical protein
MQRDTVEPDCMTDCFLHFSALVLARIARLLRRVSVAFRPAGDHHEIVTMDGVEAAPGRLNSIFATG